MARSVVSEIFGAAAPQLVQQVTFRSQVTPEYVYDPWAPSAPPQEGGGWLMDFVKPEVVIQTAAGPVEIAPYGKPTENYVPHMLVGAVATLVGLVVLIGWVSRRL